MEIFRIALALFALSWLNLAKSEPIIEAAIELEQSRAAIITDQRLVGNSRAQAKRRGTIKSVPQLFVYHTDATAAYHLQGTRDAFTRFLEIAVREFREERSMVDLDKLLERAHRPIEDDEAPEYLTIDDLPTRDLIIVLYYTDDCTE